MRKARWWSCVIVIAIGCVGGAGGQPAYAGFFDQLRGLYFLSATACIPNYNQLKICSPFVGCTITPCKNNTWCVEPSSGGVAVAQCVPLAEPVSCANAYAKKVVAKIDGDVQVLSQACAQPLPYCVDGACVADEPACLDIDGSTLQPGALQLDPADTSWQTVGTVKLGGEVAGTDACKGPGFLLEQVCIKTYANGAWGMGAAQVYFDCQSKGMMCQAGKCVPNPADKCPQLPGVQNEYPYDLDGDGVHDSCEAPAVADKCPDLAGVQPEFLFDTNGDGVMDSCTEPLPRAVDKCPDVVGYQADFPYDTDGDGMNDSCKEPPTDQCPELRGLQPEFPYDTNGDGVPDSCKKPAPRAVDKCPELAGVQTVFPFDTDGDGEPDGCVAPVPPGGDYCPDLEGVQSGFPFDLNGDGINESCMPVDADVCTDPDPAKSYPAASIYSYGKEPHLGFCLAPVGYTGQILHVICDAKGKFTTDVTTCEPNHACLDGACSTCGDTDGGINWDVKGIVQSLTSNGAQQISKDHCESWFEKDGQWVSRIVEFFCNGNSSDWEQKMCPSGTHCEAPDSGPPACVPNAATSCTDGDGGVNWEVLSSVSGVGIDGQPFDYKDGCGNVWSEEKKQWVEGKWEYTCQDGKAAAAMKLCDEGTHCEDTAKGPACVQDLEATCTDGDGGIVWAVQSSVQGTDNLGKPFTKTDQCGGVYDTSAKAWTLGPEEFYCDGNQVKSEVKLCPKGEHCVDPEAGPPVCVNNCLDTDPANDPEVFGELVDLQDIPHPDFCEGNLLKQFACDPVTNEKVVVPTVECPNGCEGGVCK